MNRSYAICWLVLGADADGVSIELNNQRWRHSERKRMTSSAHANWCNFSCRHLSPNDSIYSGEAISNGSLYGMMWWLIDSAPCGIYIYRRRIRGRKISKTNEENYCRLFMCRPISDGSDVNIRPAMEMNRINANRTLCAMEGEKGKEKYRFILLSLWSCFFFFVLAEGKKRME